MKSPRTIRVAGLFALALTAALPAFAGNIYVDEGFENGTAFANLGYPMKDNTTLPTPANIAATQGINIRAVDAAQAAIPMQMTNTGTISTTMAYAGTHSLQLASGQSAAVVNNQYTNYGLNWYQVVQFAVSVNAATIALPAGTVVGNFKEEWATSTSLAVSVVYQLNFVRNTSGGVDIVVSNNATKIGTIGGAGQWVVVTVIADKNGPGSTSGGVENWECYDPILGKYKGPLPVGDPFHGSGSYAQFTTFGIYAFANSNNPSNLLSGTAIGNDWCYDPTAAPDGRSNNTYLLDWSITAQNSGTLFADEFSHSAGLYQAGKGVDPIDQDGAARMVDFYGPQAAASSADWTLLQ